jgi:sensor histidine kinase YesM
MRIGIRGKLLLSFLGTIIVVLGMEMIAQNAAFRTAQEYQVSLSQYHLVHRFRIKLDSLRGDLDRYLKEPSSLPVTTLYQSITELTVMMPNLEKLANLSVKTGFEVRATGYGLDAYLPLAEHCIAYRLSGRTDYYSQFAKSDRIAGYMDNYLSRLLTILMNDGEVAYTRTLSQSRTIQKTTLAGMILMGLVAFIFISLVANSITSPLRALAKASQRLSMGDLDVKIAPVRSKDEVKVLADSFFRMSENIRDLVEGLKEKVELESRLHDEELALVSMGKMLREAQFTNLQDQMRPHFLFNALNSIARTALIEEAPNTEKLSLSLAHLLRSAIGEAGPYITVGEEVDLVKEYLSFQKVRFGERLGWEIRFDDALAPVEIPRFLLQPVVENAVRHGIEPSENGGRVLVAIKKVKNRLIFTILNTGVEIELAKLKSIRHSLVPHESSSGQEEESGASIPNLGLDGAGVGLSNLAARLSILFGTESRLVLYSRKGKATLVRMWIPAKGLQR